MNVPGMLKNLFAIFNDSKNFLFTNFSNSSRGFSNTGKTIDEHEINHFDNVAQEWWNEHGAFKILHKINPVRLSFIKENILKNFDNKSKKDHPLKNLNILDVGCGGGLLSEPLARMGAKLTSIDASEQAINTAKNHAKLMNLKIDYQNTSIENLKLEPVDVVCALEIVEHVEDPVAFLTHCASFVNPGGVLILSTLNKTLASYFFGIVAAEQILKWVPPGTHSYTKFLKPSELTKILRELDFDLIDLKGINLNVLSNEWHLSARTDINYICCFCKKS